MAFFHAKTDLRNKYLVDFKSGWFFEQDHLLNLFILGKMREDDLNVHVFEKRNWGPFRRKDFKWKKNMGVQG